MKERAILLLLALLSGCAYYNGMYNANRLAHDAEKAEREGRTFDAANLWGQVGVKADTMLARHGSSKWADDAKLLRGKSYQRLGDCNSAVTVLRGLLASSADAALIEEGSFLLGRCYQALGNPDEASHAFARLINSADPARRREALYQHGRSLRLGGRFEQAVAVLERTDDPRARGERAASLAGAGRIEAASLLADSLIAVGDTAAPWDSLLSFIGMRDPVRASALADRLIALPQATALQRTSWMMNDAERIGAVDPDRGESRVKQALALNGAGAAAARGRLILLEVRMERGSTLDSLRALEADLDSLLSAGGSMGIMLGRLSRSKGNVLELTDSAAAGAPSSDMRLFLAAESARDSLGMRRLAINLFRRMAEEYPSSPYAPKALLALGAIDSTSAQLTDSLLHERYAESPYLLAARGEDAPGFSALEDSMLTFANGLRRARPINPNRPVSQPTPTVRSPQN